MTVAELLCVATMPPLAFTMAVHDVRRRRIPSRHLAALFAAVACVLATGAFVDGKSFIWRALLGGCLAATPLLVAAMVQTSGMGGGDIKLAGLLGTALGGFSPWLSILMVAVALVGTALVSVVRKATHGPLAPGLGVSAVGALALHLL